MSSSAVTPLRRPATEADLLALPEEGRGFELISGELVEKHAGVHHGQAQGVTSALLHPYRRRQGGGEGPGGWLIIPEQLVRLAPHTVRPDLVGWRRERMPAMPALQEDGVVELRPDWICEILSPGHAADDLVRKRRIYHQHQVPHYWIIDPRDSTLTVNRWSAAGFVAVLVAQAGDVVRAEPFDQVELPVAELFLDDEG